MDKSLPVACIDFDGTIHSYENGWQGGEIYGTVLPGFFDWAAKACGLFRLVIYSTRSRSPQQLSTMSDWMKGQLQTWWQRNGNSGACPIVFEYALTKPPAFVSLDDAAIQFNGNWKDPALEPIKLAQFKPWHKGGQPVRVARMLTMEAALSTAIMNAVGSSCQGWEGWPGTDAIAAAVIRELGKKGMLK